MVNNALHLQQVSDLLQVDIETLRALNPQYKRDIDPGNTRPSVLKLPAAETYAFIDKEDTVYTHRIEELLANCISANNSNGSLPSGATREKKELKTNYPRMIILPVSSVLDPDGYPDLTAHSPFVRKRR